MIKKIQRVKQSMNKAPLVCFQSGVRIFCDDQSVEKAVHSAVEKFNQGLTVGHKMALYQIVSATKVLRLHTGKDEIRKKSERSTVRV